MTAPWFRVPDCQRPDAVHIVGAGLAGSALARQLAELGIAVTVSDRAEAIGTGASGNPTGIFRPFVTRDAGPVERLHRDAYAHLLAELGRAALTPDSLGRTGVLQLLERPYHERDDLVSLDRAAASERAGVALASGALWFEDGGWLRPAALCQAWLAHPLIEVIVGDERLPSASAARPVILATGHALSRMPGCEGFALIPARGQITAFRRSGGLEHLACVLTGHRYAIPVGDTVYVGASFDRGNDDTTVREADNLDNLAGLSHLLASPPSSLDSLYSRAAIRATTPDRLPLVGALPDFAAFERAYADLRHGRDPAHYPDAPSVAHTWVLGGFGSRGIVQSPWAAALLARWIAGQRDQDQDLQAWSSLLHPGRFLLRRLRRGRQDDRPN